MFFIEHGFLLLISMCIPNYTLQFVRCRLGLERCVSGLNGNPGKVVYEKSYREFESPSLRAFKKLPLRKGIFCCAERSTTTACRAREIRKTFPYRRWKSTWLRGSRKMYSWSP